MVHRYDVPYIDGTPVHRYMISPPRLFIWTQWTFFKSKNNGFLRGFSLNAVQMVGRFVLISPILKSFRIGWQFCRSEQMPRPLLLLMMHFEPKSCLIWWSCRFKILIQFYPINLHSPKAKYSYMKEQSKFYVPSLRFIFENWGNKKYFLSMWALQGQ